MTYMIDFLTTIAPWSWLFLVVPLAIMGLIGGIAVVLTEVQARRLWRNAPREQ